MKKTKVKEEGQVFDENVIIDNNRMIHVTIDDSSIELLADRVIDKLMPLMFVCSRVASRDTIRTPMRDLRAIFKDVVEEATVAHGFYSDFVKQYK